MTSPLRISFDVACPVEHAFAMWTSRISTWWPPDHTISGDPDLVVVLEGAVGGKDHERTPAGVEHDWEIVTVSDPPRRLSYLWRLGRSEAEGTDVEITFAPQGATATRIEIEHRGWERLGDTATVWRDRNRVGWETLLPHFAWGTGKESSDGFRHQTGSVGPKTAPGTSEYTMYKDEQADPPTLVCQVGSTTLKYHLRAIEDLHAWLLRARRLGPTRSGGREEARHRRHRGSLRSCRGQPRRRLVWPAQRLSGTVRHVPAAVARATRAGGAHPRRSQQPDERRPLTMAAARPTSAAPEDR